MTVKVISKTQVIPTSNRTGPRHSGAASLAQTGQIWCAHMAFGASLAAGELWVLRGRSPMDIRNNEDVLKSLDSNWLKRFSDVLIKYRHMEYLEYVVTSGKIREADRMKMTWLHTQEQPSQFSGQKMGFEGGKPFPVPSGIALGCIKCHFGCTLRCLYTGKAPCCLHGLLVHLLSRRVTWSVSIRGQWSPPDQAWEFPWRSGCHISGRRPLHHPHHPQQEGLVCAGHAAAHPHLHGVWIYGPTGQHLIAFYYIELCVALPY